MAGDAVFRHPEAIANAREERASLSGEIPPRDRYVTRLKNLPKGANLSVEVQTDGALVAVVLDQKSVDSLPNATRPLFTGTGTSRIKFELKIPRSDTYFLILFNRNVTETRQFSIAIIASVGEVMEGPADETRNSEAAARISCYQSRNERPAWTPVFADLTTSGVAA